MQEEPNATPKPKSKVDDLSSQMEILEQVCRPGSRVFFFGRHDNGKVVLSAEINKFILNENKMYTQPTMLGRQPYALDPGTMLVAQVIGFNGIFRFPVDLQHIDRDQGYMFHLQRRLARIEQRRHRRINIFATGSIREITGERRMLIENPVPSDLSKSGMRIWVDIGNIHSMREYNVELEFLMHKTDPFAPKFNLKTTFHIMRIFLSGDGSDIPYHYEAAGYFYEDPNITRHLESFIERFDSYVPNLENQKVQFDTNQGKIATPRLKKKRT